MTVLYLPVKTRLLRLQQSWKLASKLNLTPEYYEETDRSKNYRYYR